MRIAGINTEAIDKAQLADAKAEELISQIRSDLGGKNEELASVSLGSGAGDILNDKLA